MAKLLTYGKRKPKKYKPARTSKETKSQKEPLIAPPAEYTILYEGECVGTPYEIAYSPFSGGISYSLSKPSVRIVAAVDRMAEDRARQLIEYACKCREYYVELHVLRKEGERLSMPAVKKQASEKALEYIAEKHGKRAASTLLSVFEKACKAYEAEVEKRNAAYNISIHEQFCLHQTITDDESTDKLDAWELDV